MAKRAKVEVRSKESKLKMLLAFAIPFIIVAAGTFFGARILSEKMLGGSAASFSNYELEETQTDDASDSLDR